MSFFPIAGIISPVALGIGAFVLGKTVFGSQVFNVEPFWVQFIQGAVIFLAVLFGSLNNKRKVASSVRRSEQTIARGRWPPS